MFDKLPRGFSIDMCDQSSHLPFGAVSGITGGCLERARVSNK